MTDKPKVWIDPNDCGLVTVEAAEEKRRQEAERQRRAEAKRQLREDALKGKKMRQGRQAPIDFRRNESPDCDLYP